MVRHTPRIRFTSLVLVLTAGLTLGGLYACQKADETAKPAPQAAAPPVQPAFHVTHVDLGNAIGADKKVTASSVTFKPNDTIYASILSEGVTPRAALAVRWTFEDGQVVNESTQNIAPTGPAVTEFHIAKPDGLPAGKYKVEVSANGQPAAAVQFAVVE